MERKNLEIYFHNLGMANTHPWILDFVFYPSLFWLSISLTKVLFHLHVFYEKCLIQGIQFVFGWFPIPIPCLIFLYLFISKPQLPILLLYIVSVRAY